MSAPNKPRIAWTGVQWMCCSERASAWHVWARWRIGFGVNPADAYAAWMEVSP